MNRDVSWRRRRFALVLRMCTVEALEDRRVLTATAELSAGDLFSQLAIDRSAHRESSLLVQFRPGASAAAIEAAEFAGT